MEVALDQVDSVVADIETLERLARGEDEWFYDLEAELPAVGIRLGLHDSTALFIECTDGALASAIAAHFQNTKVAEERSP
jgi:hypothetical protein